jgi:hypothetical protein
MAIGCIANAKIRNKLSDAISVEWWRHRWQRSWRQYDVASRALCRFLYEFKKQPADEVVSIPTIYSREIQDRIWSMQSSPRPNSETIFLWNEGIPYHFVTPLYNLFFWYYFWFLFSKHLNLIARQGVYFL